MSSYESLAPFYDRLTCDVDYIGFADRYETAFLSDGGPFHLLLDLCCGTGSMSLEMSRRGYELIAVDASEDMLMEAREKCASLPVPPLFLQQDAAKLDLYGTVDAAFCSLEGINYLAPAQLTEMISRLRNFIRPHGLFLFDIRSPEYLKHIDGSTSIDEDEDVFCVWRADFDPEENALIYGMDLFSRKGKLWTRSREEHVEYAHSPAFLKSLFLQYGFEDFTVISADERLYIQVRRCEYSL
ncbi:MAG: class I SAM-dependent methyltransferase [Oscillospiraceae bacterium]|nr:class I SAM-dependent methyltransferase [Oscillospiraceae bacterium]